MKAKQHLIALMLALLIPAQALAQDDAPADLPTAQPAEQPTAEAPPSVPPLWLWPSLQNAPADPMSGQWTEVERKVLAGAMVAGSVPLILYGLGKLANTERDHSRDRHIEAHQAGASIFAGMGMLAQGAHELARDSPEAKRRAAKWAAQETSAPISLNPVLPLLQAQAEVGRDRRSTQAVLVIAGGILLGAGIGALPVSDRVVDRRVLVATGVGVAAAGVGAAAYLHLTPSPEEEALAEAQQRQARMEQLKRQP